jgi:hypothetical protein
MPFPHDLPDKYERKWYNLSVKEMREMSFNYGK